LQTTDVSLGLAFAQQLPARIPPLVHRNPALVAAEQGISLNRLASAKLAA